jgi:hypothetical protein
MPHLISVASSAILQLDLICAPPLDLVFASQRGGPDPSPLSVVTRSRWSRSARFRARSPTLTRQPKLTSRLSPLLPSPMLSLLPLVVSFAPAVLAGIGTFQISQPLQCGELLINWSHTGSIAATDYNLVLIPTSDQNQVSRNEPCVW